MATTDEPAAGIELPPPQPESDRPRQKAVTIGAVCKALRQEFPDISISKIRYLEDQKLLSPRRTQGGYRLYSPNDVQRLRTILRLQRDEFLPLRVIRQELAGGRSEPEVASRGDGRSSLRRSSVTVRETGALYSLDDVVDETSADPRLIRELVDFGVIKGEMRAGSRYFDETEREIIRAVSELARYGVGDGICASFARRLTERRSCCRASLRPRCGRAIPSDARRPSRRSRTLPRSPRISSICC